MKEEDLEIIEVIVIEEIDVEECLKRGEQVPKANRYVIRVDKQKITIHKGQLSGTEILALVQKSPQNYKLYQHKRAHQPSLVGPDKIVDLTHHGIERFTTMPKDTTEGRDAIPGLSRQFQLPAADEAYLVSMGLSWETVHESGSAWLIISGWKLPEGYSAKVASLALLIPPSYSDTQIDMAYFYPAISRSDGKPIGALSVQALLGQAWQRWSRHRTAANPWRPAEDDFASHLSLVDEWLLREFEKA